MDSKKELLDLIELIKSQTGLTQAEISKQAGYNEKYLTETLSKGIASSKTISNLRKSFGLENTTIIETTDYLTRRRGAKLKSLPFMVPFIPVKAQAGYTRALDQELFVDTLEKYALPPGVNPQGASWRYWEIEGDSMEPVFHNKDVILTSQVPSMDWENLRNFYLHVIVTSMNVLFKRVFCKNPLEWVLISENEALHDQQLIQVEDVKEVWVYRRSIVNKAPPSKVFEIKV